MSPLDLSSSKLTRRDSPPNSTIAICLLVAAVVVVLITVGLLFLSRRRVRRHAHVDANSFASSRLAQGYPTRTARTINLTTTPAADVSVSLDPVADEGHAGEISNRNGERHSPTVAERIKNEIIYPQGGIGETPSVPSSRNPPSSSRELIVSGQEPSPLPQDVTLLNNKKRPRLAAIITELPLSNLHRTPQSNSNTQQEGFFSGNIKPSTPTEPRSARLPRNGSVVSLQVRPALETMRRTSETAVPTPSSAVGRVEEVRGSPILDVPLEEPIRPRARSSSLSQDSTPRKGVVQPVSKDPVEIKVTRHLDSETNTFSDGSSGPLCFEHGNESERRRRVQKSRVLSVISERSINRRESTSTHRHHSTGVSRNLSLGAVSIVHPPPPYTLEDLNSSIVPPLPNTTNCPKLSLSSFHVSNGGTEPPSTPSKGKSSSLSELYDRPLPQIPDIEEQPSPVYERGTYNAHIPRRMTKAHHPATEQYNQRVGITRLEVAHRKSRRSNSAPNDLGALLQTRDLGSPSHPLPPRGDISIRF